MWDVIYKKPNHQSSSSAHARLGDYHYVDVRDASHISAALRFTHAHNIRISVKSRLFRTISEYRELGAGVIATDAHHFVSSKGMDITGGYEQWVGLAGVFAQGGGVESFTTTYGMMADKAVEFEVVTVDGKVRTINQCNEPELLWAMCGGGGGTVAVLAKYRVQVYPSLSIYTYTVTANCTGDTSDATQNVALRAILTAHAVPANLNTSRRK
ncbi:FAD linked oxidase N-terminal [Penicillium robsamsonii]|uniref:FAD linked oxidase N-terminal n=1 Tax=Penicillium robsamsonii TaxID=1792511 RepID=UPI002548D2DF|nr:FAD linked oxidase N-terminal [Penicillium robsamsonii]KAJ5826499.1 FAD linked oxidase N-terminal [Penicillium robsamsonii]